MSPNRLPVLFNHAFFHWQVCAVFLMAANFTIAQILQLPDCAVQSDPDGAPTSSSTTTYLDFAANSANIQTDQTYCVNFLPNFEFIRNLLFQVTGNSVTGSRKEPLLAGEIRLTGGTETQRCSQGACGTVCGSYQKDRSADSYSNSGDVRRRREDDHSSLQPLNYTQGCEQSVVISSNSSVLVENGMESGKLSMQPYI
ncbi:unnamed protein product [Dicrocoelium dendriticum]|nr:unnamed protein product [Dicrocoelium dendriticum]